MAEIGDLREKLEEAIATKEQLLKDMTKALGVKEEELAVFEERQKMNEAARQKRAIEVCSRVVGHWQHRVSGAAFESWRLHEMEQRRMRELCSRVVVKMMKRGMDAAFVFWQAQATRQRMTREVCARAVTKMQRLGVDCAFTTWREDVEEQKAERALEAAERAKAEAVVEAAERAGKGAQDMTRLKGELEGARQELMNKENARKTLEAEVEALTAQLDAGQGEVKIVKAEVVKAQRSCMETQRVLDDLKTRQQKVREEGLKKLTARMLWK